MRGKDFSWPMALVVAFVVAGVVVLAALGKDAGALVSLVTAGIAALLYGRVEQVREQVNGNSAKHLEMIKEALRTLSVTDPVNTKQLQQLQSTIDGPQGTEDLRTESRAT